MIRERRVDHSVWWFFAMAFAFTWGCQLPLTLASRGIISDSSIIRFVDHMATFGPLVAAFLLTAAREGWKGLLELIRRGWDTRFKGTWWIPTLFLLPVMQISAVVISSLVETGGWPALGTTVSSGLFISFAVILVQVIGEEFGWRGYAIGRLQGRWNAVVSSLILGLFWGVWHIQLWMRAGEASRTSPFLATLAYIFAQSIIYTWLFNNTRGSLLPAILYHASDNFLGSKLLGIYDSFAGSVVYFSIVFAVTILICVIFGPRRLMRGKSTENGSGFTPPVGDPPE